MKHSKNISIKQVLAWADAHKAKTGFWPRASREKTRAGANLTWTEIGYRLRRGGYPLWKLLEKHRNVPRVQSRSAPLSEKKILAWADAHHRRTGRWPDRSSGVVRSASAVTWSGIERAFNKGKRGLVGGSTLAKFLESTGRGRRWRRSKDRDFSTQMVLDLADLHHRRTGKWPDHLSGRVMGLRGGAPCTWQYINAKISHNRGQFGAKSVLGLLARHKRRPLRPTVHPLTVKQVLAWIDEHYRRTGHWPTRKSGTIRGTLNENWSALDQALRGGSRGLPRGLSLARLMNKHRASLRRPRNRR